MKKLFPTTILLSMLSFQASALNMEISGDLGNITSTNKQITLYNFSDSLLHAAKNCTAYSEDFTENNPQMASLAELFGGNEWKILINIEGLNQDNLCHFTVKQNAGELTLGEYDCLISTDQQKELYQAMLDRSTEPVTETFTSYMEIDNGTDKPQKRPIETTMTDSRFNIAWSKISSAACTSKNEEPDENAKTDFLNNFNKFSETFIENLQNCHPAKETKSMLFVTKTISVLGHEKELCKISSPPFELLLPDEKLKEINSLEQIMKLSTDKTYSRYLPEYFTNNLLFELDRCPDLKKNHNAGTMTNSEDNIQITSGLSSDFNDNKCTITFTNKLTIDENEQDYSRICTIEKETLTTLLAPYQNLLEQTRAKSEIKADGTFTYEAETVNNSTQAADKALAEELLKLKLCQTPE